MNGPWLMAQAGVTLSARLRAEPGCTELPVPTIAEPTAALQWDNLLLRAGSFRRAHVETLVSPGRWSVLHVVVFPHLDDATPIFGLDIVAGPARVTGIFLDLTPVTGARARPRLSDVADLSGFAERRALPDWADVFSAEVLAIRPADTGEVSRAIGLADTALTAALAAAGRSRDATPAEIAAGQARYVNGQRRNESTLRMLTGLIGAAAARRFLDEVLFPPVPTVAVPA